MPRDPLDQAIAGFATRTFGLRGTLRLHRAALGLDLLRAPLNIFLAPVFLLTRLGALVAGWVGAKGLSRWLSARRVLLRTEVARRIAARVARFVAELDDQELGPRAPDTKVAEAIADYVGVRSAVAELVTMALVLGTGVVLFHAATPGLISLSGPLAELRAHAEAVRSFPLGPFLGRAFYGIVPVSANGWQVASTLVGLAMAASLVTAFAGVLADPVQVATGTHRRRLRRMIDRLATGETPPTLAREHLAARAGDISDLVLSVLRLLR